METPPRPPANDGFERFTADGRSFPLGKSGLANIASGDGLATPADVLLALTYGLELVQHGAMLVAKGGRLQLANRAALPGFGLDCWRGTEQKTALMKLYDQDQGLVVNEKALISLYGLRSHEAAR